ncbi:MAG: sulfurtransferase complex subunit TusB [Gammaproteobacteria bacterium]|nr:sulfurtransferase complex subunit TusB [Gammaproteobacteria bacterium]NIN39627.1 sulfurtransferase complex subunit TusB [Gammaproteobacteria bacterium]NIO25184.1 sulfurtransferase complex subunit TusB [Gammaproteobacteria bacterium]NIO65813.1 sulfurtransferase complex subunit TusB [Gammaproteobacteria bacterium]NIP45748.1 sulfurtransferase complex subunit TusB [Gammaproteobacteria bacterium]
MGILHTINKSPFEKNSLDTCLRIATEGSSVLFIEDGVYGAMDGTSLNGKVSDASNRLRFYVLGPDLEARGLSGKKVMDCIEIVDYDGFVDLVVGHDATHACL